MDHSDEKNRATGRETLFLLRADVERSCLIAGPLVGRL